MDTGKNQQIPKSRLKPTLFAAVILLTILCIIQNVKAGKTSERIIDKLADDLIYIEPEGESGNKNSEELARLKEAAKAEAEFRAKYRDIRDYVKFGDSLYGRTREMFGKDDLPKLYELLKDDNYAPYWTNVSQVIGFISDDPNSIPFLLDYFQRNDGTKNFSMLGKLWSIAWIGKIGGNQADSILRKAVTKEGARELAKNWIDEELWQDEIFKGNKDAVVAFVRSDALKGLVLSGKQENLDFVTKLFNEQMAISLQNKKPAEFIDALGDAMTLKDYIADHGIDGYFAIWHSDDGRYIMPYVEKYSFWRRLKELEENSPEVSFNKKANDLKGYIKLGGVSYQYVRERYSKEYLPVLYTLLSDENFAPYWHNIANVIGIISDDPNSVPVLLEYFQRDEGSKVYNLLGKICTIEWIGLIGGDMADSILQKAVTREGAIELAKDWIEDGLWADKNLSKELLIGYIQGCAMKGLVFSRKPGNIKIVEGLYTKEKDRIIEAKSGRVSGALIDAMAANDYIADHNEDAGAYFRRDPEIDFSFREYSRKYSFSYPEEDSTKTNTTSEQFIDKLANDLTSEYSIQDPNGTVSLEQARTWIAQHPEIDRILKYDRTRILTYDLVKKTVSSNQLPFLYRLLDDKEYVPNPLSNKIAYVISYISDDPNSVPVLVKYFQRNDGVMLNTTVKIEILSYIGMVGCKEADSVLRKAITEEGARELIKGWTEDLSPVETRYVNSDVIMDIQSAAAMGLIFTGKAENWKIVEDLYNQHKEIAIKKGDTNSFTNHLGAAMGTRDFIIDNNNDVEAYFRIMHDGNQINNAMTAYYKKYLDFANEMPFFRRGIM